MNKALAGVLLGLCVSLLACKPSEEPAGEGPSSTKASGGSGGRATGSGGSGGTSGSGGNQAGGGTSGSGGNQAGGGTSGSGGATTASGGSSGSGASTAGAGGTNASGGAGGGSDAASADAPAASDSKPAGDTGRPAILSEGADYPGRPEVRICPKDWTHEQCCEFLCRCLSDLCTDAPKGQKGIPTCKTWCPKLSNMAMRCHVYHCFESVSMGGKKDHDSHCGHAADQVPGGMCRKDVYE